MCNNQILVFFGEKNSAPASKIFDLIKREGREGRKNVLN
ncbi:hypothetical protein Cabys_3269 [Caldithrix abyssi DSM 13497]|uniref:Uncharacterized protein n=1 Tax=Caldithrix abyssi DSM 13497 TaxID=880073 RepID=A0A1J1CCN6_CALAY|nr:hypothetical protein Cabys_3269 [Caldithrix abyssi DSM 13497]